MLYIGSDHRGFNLKEKIKQYLQTKGVNFSDMGNDHLDPDDDYVIFSERVADAVSKDSTNLGIVICGSGVGVDITANKVDGIRCALVSDEARAVQSREHENVNVIALPADIIEESQVYKIVDAFLNTQFSEETRHLRRLEELKEVESNHQ